MCAVLEILRRSFEFDGICTVDTQSKLQVGKIP